MVDIFTEIYRPVARMVMIGELSRDTNYLDVCDSMICQHPLGYFTAG
jgi:hypothetical protein